MPSSWDEGAWYVPPEDPGLPARDIQALRGEIVAFTRAVVLGQIPPERIRSAREALPPVARALLDRAPEPEVWVPVGTVRAFFGWAAAQMEVSLAGPVARQHARRDAGQGDPTGRRPPERVLPGSGALELMAGLEAMWGRYFQGGTIRADRVEAGQAWVSVWSEDLFPGWASVDLCHYFVKALAEGYGLEAQVTYLPPPPGRPWWHRYHLRWEAGG